MMPIKVTALKKRKEKITLIIGKNTALLPPQCEVGQD